MCNNGKYPFKIDNFWWKNEDPRYGKIHLDTKDSEDSLVRKIKSIILRLLIKDPNERASLLEVLREPVIMK